MRATGVMLFTYLAAGFPAQAEDFKLAFPVDCTLGRDCIIQNYVDLDPGDGWRGYQCGRYTARYRLFRDDKPIIDRLFTVELH